MIQPYPPLLNTLSAAKVPTLGTYLAAAAAAGGSQLVQAVVYDLPDRDCSAESSAGEYSIANGGAALYEAYIDAIAAQIESTSPYSNANYHVDTRHQNTPPCASSSLLNPTGSPTSSRTSPSPNAPMPLRRTRPSCRTLSPSCSSRMCFCTWTQDTRGGWDGQEI